MDIVTVRNLNPAVKAKLKERAARHGRSMEAEVRSILAAAVAESDAPVGLVERIRSHFGDHPVTLPPSEHEKQTQRPVEFQTGTPTE